MAISLPTIGSGAWCAMYPLTRHHIFQTDVARFVNLSEQRCATGAGQTQFALQYSYLNRADLTALQNFVAAVKGSYDSFVFPFVYALGTDSILNCKLLSNSFSWQETFQDTYAGRLTFQTVTSEWKNWPPPQLTFPTFSNGLVAQFPITRTYRGLNYVSRLPSGPVYSFPLVGSGLPNVPTTMPMGWRYRVLLKETDLDILQGFFIATMGMFATFSWTDPGTGTVYQNCRFDSNTLSMNYADLNQVWVDIAIAQVP